MRNSFVAICIVTAASVFGTACTRQPETITILGEASSNLAAMEEISKTYEQQQNIKIVFRKADFETALKEANQDLAIGSGRYDIILQYNFTLSSYVEGNYVWQLEDLKKKFPDVATDFQNSLFPSAWKEVGYYYKKGRGGDSAAFGFPFAANTLLLVYNKQMFDNPENKAAYLKETGHALTVPQSWTEFRNVAKFFTRNGTIGVALQGATGGWLYYEIASILASEGAPIFNKKNGWETARDQSVNLEQPAVRDLIKYYLSLKPYTTMEFLKTDAVVQRELMRKGNVAMALMWSDYVYKLGAPDKTGSIDFGFAPIPGAASPLAGGSYYLNKQSKHVESAYRYVAWLMQPEQQQKMARLGLASPQDAAYTKEVLSSVPYASALKASIERGVYAFEANRDSDLVQSEITTAIQTAWIDPGAVDNALATATRNINQQRTKLLAPQ